MARRNRSKPGAETVDAVPVRRWFGFLASQQAQAIALPVTLLFGVLIRWCVSLHGYSGRGSPPLFGDYEAQRHWMELTVHLPPSRWYYYDLQYWGLDYPPLTAFQSWICGKVAQLIDPSWVELDTSRGIETHASKLFMRASALVFEFLILVPPTILLFERSRRLSWVARQTAIFSVLLQPCLLLVDHGHFQYNSVMLGFLVWAVYFAAREQYVLMAVAFCCSFMFKQMGLYYAPAVFFFLLAKCFQPRHGAVLFIKLGLAVLVTIGVMLLPWMSDLDQLRQILTRVFPVARGLYEDKVANIWCALNVVIKLRSIFGPQTLVRLATGATALAFIPSCAHLFVTIRRLASSGVSNDRACVLLCYCLLNTSLAFFLFSFQVHEKSILLPLAPALLLIDKEEQAVNFFVQVALFSMYPLLFRDGLQIPYWVMAISWSFLRGCPACPANRRISPAVVRVQWMGTVAMVAIHLAHAFIPPPVSLPDIYVVLNVVFSCGMFTAFLAYFNYRQFAYSRSEAPTPKQKTQ
ncbi:Glucosyltransferase-like protein [Coemansia sp. RSA 552]|nr:Glucosyltransferase-like protein [Coemansia sp. RSA 552]